MPFRETSRLLGSSGDDLTDFQRFLIHFKKYYLLPLSILIPTLVLFAVYINSVNEVRIPVLEEAREGEIFSIPDPEPISELIANGSVKVERFNLIITKGKLKPDGTKQNVYLVNGQYPGPIIRIRQSSILIVTVTNHLSIPITIHLHGIHQRGSFPSDGVPKVTQDPIPPGGKFTITANTWPQAGTFFYHAHTGLDIIWIGGPLIIDDEPETYKSWPKEYQYDEDRIFYINGIYHQTLDEMITELTGPVFRYPRVDAVTINGKGHGLDPPPPFVPDWEANDTTTTVPLPQNVDLDVTNVKIKKRYRFRVISAISDGTYNCWIPDHKFTVIEMDGIYTEPLETENFVISPGQRYSLILAADKTIDNYFVVCKLLEVSGPSGLSVMRYTGAPLKNNPGIPHITKFLNETVLQSPVNNYTELNWVLDELTPNFALKQTDVYEVPQEVDHEFLIDVEEVTDGVKNKYLVNGHYFQEPNISYINQLKNSINITDPPQVFEILKNDVVQIIFQNQRLFSVCFGHPWHLHGHTFHVVAHGPDRYNATTDREKIEENVKMKRKMQFRDTVMLNGHQTAPVGERPQYCGWTAIRFVANNPGLWLAHCHVTPHMIMGKRFVIWEHTAEDPYFETLFKYQLPH